MIIRLANFLSFLKYLIVFMNTFYKYLYSYLNSFYFFIEYSNRFTSENRYLYSNTFKKYFLQNQV